jgi:hypothetical protein
MHMDRAGWPVSGAEIAMNRGGGLGIVGVIVVILVVLWLLGVIKV